MSMKLKSEVYPDLAVESLQSRLVLAVRPVGEAKSFQGMQELRRQDCFIQGIIKSVRQPRGLNSIASLTAMYVTAIQFMRILYPQTQLLSVSWNVKSFEVRRKLACRCERIDIPYIRNSSSLSTSQQQA
jgi:hypothetical protein